MGNGSDGIYSDDSQRSGSRRGGRHRQSREGDRYDDDIKHYIVSIYKEFSLMYAMIKEETNKIRDNDEMMFTQSIKKLDGKDVELPKRLDGHDSLKMLKSLCEQSTRVKEKLNKNYRTKFFQLVKRKMDHAKTERYVRSRYDEERRHRDRADRD